MNPDPGMQVPPERLRCRFSVSHRFLIAAGCASLIIATRCAPGVVLDPPAEWPVEWRGRSLYHTPRSLIYATSPAAAGEVDRLVNRIADEHQLPASGDSTDAKGLIIVADRNDVPVCEDLQQRLAMFVAGQDQLAGTKQPETHRAAAIRERLTGDGAALAPILDHLLVMIPTPVADNAVHESLEFPMNISPTIAWAGVYPTDALIREQSGKLADLMLDVAAKRNQIPASALWLAKPLMPLIHNTLANEIIKQRDPAFENIVRQDDPEWIADREARKRAIAVWSIVRRNDRSQEDYASAYAKSRAAADRLPNDTDVLRSLAAAEYRTDRYAPALSTLDRIQELERERVASSEASSIGDLAGQLMPHLSAAVDKAVEQASTGRPSDLALRAMAAHKFGQHDKAEEAYRQLKSVVESRYKKARSERAWLTETAAVLGKSETPTTQEAEPITSE